MNGKIVRWLAAVIAVAALAVWSLVRFYPPLPNPLALELEIPTGETGRSDPLVASGHAYEADFIFVRYLDAQTIVFGYDSWGAGGPLSSPIKLAAGLRHRVEIEMPGLDQIYSRMRYHSGNRVRIVDNGVTVLDETVQHYVRDATAIWIGENPIGGSSCGVRFPGEIFRAGRPWRGGVDALFSRRDRLAGWLAECQWPVLALLVVGALIVRYWPTENWRGKLTGAAGGLRSLMIEHRCFIACAAVGTFCFAWVLTGGGFQFVYPEGFGSFYDFQAASLLQGRLDVPEAGISGEAFIHDGKYYGYFGPTPALMRLACVIFDVGFGKLSRVFMLVDYVGCLLAAYLVLRATRELVHGNTRPAGGAAVVWLTLNAGLGSTIFFLSSRAYIYHEAILCGVMFALFACWCALRHLAAPSRRWWIGSLACGLLSLHARPPTGLFALSFLAAVALLLAWRERPTVMWRHAMVAVFCAAGVLSFNGLSYLKFKNFEGAPLRLNVQYSAERLARIDGKNFHLSNLRFNFFTYVLRPNLDFEPGFPWLYLGLSKPKPFFPEARSDYADRTLALPYAMPVLFVLATAGAGLTWCASRPARGMLLATWLSIGPMAFAMLTAIATVHRYTADFCPWLIMAAAFGLAGFELVGARWRAVCQIALVLVTGWAIALTGALTLHYQGKMVWGVPDEVTQNYQRLRERVDHFVSTLHRR